MAGILGDLFGLGGGTQAPTPGLLDAAGYMDPAQYDRMRQSQSMMGLWAGLLAGGGPSLSPRNFGSALGAGLTGAQQFGSQFDESQLHGAKAAEARANVGKLATEAQTMRQGFDILRKGIEGGQFAGGAPGSGAAAPGAGSSTPNFGAGSPGALATSSTTANADLPPEARAFLDTVAGPESGGAYNARWPGTTFSGYDDHPRIFSPGPEGPSSAAGRYQIVASTWDGLNQKYNFPDFKPETQDTAAWKLAEDTYRSRTGGDLSAALKEGKLQEVQQMLKGQWGTLNMANYGSNLRKYTGGDGGGTATAGVAPVPGALAQVPSYSGALGERAAPAPAVLAAPGVNPDAPATPGAGAALGTGRTVLPPGRGLVTPQDYVDWQASGRIPSGPVNVGPSAGVPGGPTNVRQLAGEAVSAEAAGGGGPSYGYGSAGDRISPAAMAAAAAGQAPMPSAMVAPAPPVPAPSPAVTQPPAVAAAPAPSGTQPAGPLTVTLPAPPAPLPPAALPAPPTPQTATLPPQPTMPAIPPRPEIPGAPGVAGGGGYNAQAHQAQMMALGLTMMGRAVPGFISDLAGIPAAGQKAAAEAAAKQPFEIQNKQIDFLYGMAKSTWEKSADFEKDRIAAANGLTTAQYKAQLDQIGEDRKAQQTLQAKQFDKQLEIVGAGPIKGAQEAATPTTEMKDYDAYVKQEMLQGRAPLSMFEWGQQRRAAGATNITQKVEGQGQGELVKAGIEAMKTATETAQAANRRTQLYGQMAEAMQGFTPGATAELQLRGKAILKDLGIIVGEGVAPAEVFRQAGRQLQLAAAPKGQGSVSNFERELYAEAVPLMVNSPETLIKAIDIGRRLDDYDRQVAQIHRDVARQHGGLPNYVEASQRIADLGPPLSPGEMNALQALRQQNQAGKEGATTGVPPAYRWDPAANNGAGAVVPNTGR